MLQTYDQIFFQIIVHQIHLEDMLLLLYRFCNLILHCHDNTLHSNIQLKILLFLLIILVALLVILFDQLFQTSYLIVLFYSSIHLSHFHFHFIFILILILIFTFVFIITFFIIIITIIIIVIIITIIKNCFSIIKQT